MTIFSNNRLYLLWSVIIGWAGFSRDRLGFRGNGSNVRTLRCSFSSEFKLSPGSFYGLLGDGVEVEEEETHYNE